MSLKNVLGQPKAVEQLLKEIKNNTVKHAYIFYGIKGIGKKYTAIQFAKTLLCKNLVDSISCDKCNDCIRIDENLHPDLVVVDFEFQKNLLQKSEVYSTISIDTIRYIKQISQLGSYSGGYKIFIIDCAEKMQKEAANSLLKLLEEPTNKCVFVLVVSMLGILPKTIVSRCETIKFYPLDKATIYSIANFKEMDNRDVLFGSLTEVNFLDRIYEGFKKIIDGNISDIQKIADDFSQDKDLSRYFIVYLTERLFNRYKIFSDKNILDEIDFLLKNFLYNVDYRILLETFLMRYKMICNKNL
ncbi:MAG: hypothetical protein N2643_00750 [Endomicrobia bacterium]|nr:hypothetical protein [Endomicrobiia bacterium]